MDLMLGEMHRQMQMFALIANLCVIAHQTVLMEVTKTKIFVKVSIGNQQWQIWCDLFGLLQTNMSAEGWSAFRVGASAKLWSTPLAFWLFASQNSCQHSLVPVFIATDRNRINFLQFVAVSKSYRSPIHVYCTWPRTLKVLMLVKICNSVMISILGCS